MFGNLLAASRRQAAVLATAEPLLTLPLRPMPRWSNGLSLLSLLAGLLLSHALLQSAPRLWVGQLPTAGAWESLLLALCLGVVLALQIVQRWWRQRRPPPPVVFHATYLRLPTHAYAWRTCIMYYHDIVAVHGQGPLPQQALILESTERVVRLPRRQFVAADGAEQLLQALRQHIAALPQGAARLDKTLQQQRAAWLALRRQPLVTQALLGVIAVFFLNTYLKGAFNTPLGLVSWGANVPLLVQQGQWWRLLSANFLHGGYLPEPLPWLHVGMNSLGLLYLGGLLERLLGWQRFTLLYLLSGIGAMAATALQTQTLVCVGASGAIFWFAGWFCCFKSAFDAPATAAIASTAALVVDAAVDQPCVAPVVAQHRFNGASRRLWLRQPTGIGFF